MSSAEPPRRHRAHWPTQNFEAVQPGAFSASTVLFPDMASFRARDWTVNDRFIYGSHGTPTTFELEARIAGLERGDHCVLCPSGLNAITLVYIAFLKPGDELLVPINVYPANRRFVLGELSNWGVKVSLYDPSRPDTLAFTPATRLVWIEAPCPLTFAFPDVPAIVARARSRGVPTALDNTWAAGIACSALELGVDVSVQSLSKYAAGSGDTVMGAVTCRDKALHDVLKLCAMRMGTSVSGRDAAAVLMGLDTLELRYRAQGDAAAFLIGRLGESCGRYRLFHPSLGDCVGHDIWRRDCRAAAGLFSVLFDARYPTADVDRAIDALRMFRIGFGWGGPLSLVLPYGRTVASVQPLDGELVRFSVGLEPPDELLSDLVQAFDVLDRHP